MSVNERETSDLRALERLDDIEREHVASRPVPTIALGAVSIQVEGRQFCLQCSEPWPCDAAQLARAVRAQQERERALVEERDRYREALDYYANPRSYKSPPSGVEPPILWDQGTAARRAIDPSWHGLIRNQAAPSREGEA